MKVQHVPLPALRAVSLLLRWPNPMMSSLLPVGIKMAEQGETVQTIGGGLLPSPHTAVRAFLEGDDCRRSAGNGAGERDSRYSLLNLTVRPPEDRRERRDP